MPRLVKQGDDSSANSSTTSILVSNQKYQKDNVKVWNWLIQPLMQSSFSVVAIFFTFCFPRGWYITCISIKQLVEF
jgi:cobalamin biosynthesis Mg chelatase CobN